MIIFSSNVDEIQSIFSKKQNKLKNKKNILTPLAQKELERTKRRIRSTKADPFGFSWVPWAPATAVQRARKGNISTGLLFDTGNLYRSLDYNVNNSYFEVGTNVDYAEFHQYGTDNIPPRPFLGFNKEIEKDIEWVFKTIFHPTE